MRVRSSNDVVHKMYCEYQITVRWTDVEITRAENGYRNDSADQMRFPTGVLSGVRHSTNSSPSASTLLFTPPTAVVTFPPRTVVPLGAASSRCSHQSGRKTAKFGSVSFLPGAWSVILLQMPVVLFATGS